MSPQLPPESKYPPNVGTSVDVTIGLDGRRLWTYPAGDAKLSVSHKPAIPAVHVRIVSGSAELSVVLSHEAADDLGRVLRGRA